MLREEWEQGQYAGMGVVGGTRPLMVSEKTDLAPLHFQAAWQSYLIK